MRRYADTIAYPIPATLDELHGPTYGIVWAHPTGWVGPNPAYNLDHLSQRHALYEYVLNGHTGHPANWLHRPYLEDLWPHLDLPARTRLVWELAFPEIVTTYN